MITEKQVAALLDEFLDGTDLFTVEITVRPASHITVYIDGDKGVALEDCHRVNRFLEQRLNRDMEDFDLTVSSAGLDRPLKVLRQYKKLIRQEIEVVTVTGKKIAGVLEKAEKEGIVISQEVVISKKEKEMKSWSFSFGELKSVKEVITFKKQYSQKKQKRNKQWNS